MILRFSTASRTATQKGRQEDWETRRLQRLANLLVSPVLHVSLSKNPHGSAGLISINGSAAWNNLARTAENGQQESLKGSVRSPCPRRLTDNGQRDPPRDRVEHLADCFRRDERQVADQHRQAERGHAER
jgi:hypothetical protein